MKNIFKFCVDNTFTGTHLKSEFIVKFQKIFPHTTHQVDRAFSKHFFTTIIL